MKLTVNNRDDVIQAMDAARTLLLNIRVEAHIQVETRNGKTSIRRGTSIGDKSPIIKYEITLWPYNQAEPKIEPPMFSVGAPPPEASEDE